MVTYLGLQVSPSKVTNLSKFEVPDKILLQKQRYNKLSKFSHKDNYKNQGPQLPTILKNVLCLFLQNSKKLKVTKLLIGQTIRFSQSEVVLLSNASKCRQICGTRLGTF